MFIVAIAELKGDVENAVRSLSQVLETTPYELKLVFNAGFPAIVCVTADENLARAAKQAIRSQGHFPVLCARAAVCPSSDMRELRNFELAPDTLVVDRSSNSSVRYSDITVLLRATHRSTSEAREQIRERQFRPMAAVLSGGLVLTKTTKKTVTSTTAHNEQVLYVFSRSESPVILRERSAIYTALGAKRSATSFENFNMVIEELRRRCPTAIFDERLRTSRPILGVADGIEATDIFAHVLAEYLTQRSSF
jgi:hypothetical protein